MLGLHFVSSLIPQSVALKTMLPRYILIFQEYSCTNKPLMTTSVQCTDLNPSLLPVSIKRKALNVFKGTYIVNLKPLRPGQ
jgi:hypothetical protein